MVVISKHTDKTSPFFGAGDWVLHTLTGGLLSQSVISGSEHSKEPWAAIPHVQE